MRALREFCARSAGVPLHELAQDGGAVAVLAGGGAFEVLPEIFGDTAESADGVLVNVGHELMLTGG